MNRDMPPPAIMLAGAAIAVVGSIFAAAVSACALVELLARRVAGRT